MASNPYSFVVTRQASCQRASPYAFGRIRAASATAAATPAKTPASSGPSGPPNPAPAATPFTANQFFAPLF